MSKDMDLVVSIGGIADPSWARHSRPSRHGSTVSRNVPARRPA